MEVLFSSSEREENSVAGYVKRKWAGLHLGSSLAVGLESGIVTTV